MNKTYVNISNTCEKDTNSDEEIITINKSKLVDDISTLIEVAFFLGISIGATLMLLITHLVRFFQ